MEVAMSALKKMHRLEAELIDLDTLHELISNMEIREALYYIEKEIDIKTNKINKLRKKITNLKYAMEV